MVNLLENTTIQNVWEYYIFAYIYLCNIIGIYKDNIKIKYTLPRCQDMSPKHNDNVFIYFIYLYNTNIVQTFFLQNLC